MPDEIQGNVPTPQDAAAAAAPSAPSQPTPSAQSAAPEPQSQAGGGTQTDVLALLRQHGIEGQFSDPAQAIAALAHSHRRAGELGQLAGYGQEYLRHQTQFQEWMRGRQEEEQKKQQASQEWWKAPEYDPGWLSKVYRDPQSGEIRSLPGSDPSIPAKLAAWTEHQRGFIDRFSQDPLKAIQPGIERLIDQRAQQLIAQHLGGYQEQVAAREILGSHASWIYEQDPSTGARKLSAHGQAYARYVDAAQRAGITTSAAQHEYALGFVQRDYLLAAAQAAGSAGPAATQQAANERFLAGATHRPGSAPQSAATPNGAPAPAQAQAAGQRGLEELLRKNLSANGYQLGQEITRR